MHKTNKLNKATPNGYLLLLNAFLNSHLLKPEDNVIIYEYVW